MRARREVHARGAASSRARAKHSKAPDACARRQSKSFASEAGPSRGVTRDKIHLESLLFHGYHGVLPEEKSLGVGAAANLARMASAWRLRAKRTGAQACIQTGFSPLHAVTANGLTDKFEHKFSAEDVETYKPRPEVYEMARKGLGLEPHEILLVSAHPWDIAGAESFGFQGAWIDRPEAGHHLETLGFDPYYHVNGLDEFADLMAATVKGRP